MPTIWSNIVVSMRRILFIALLGGLFFIAPQSLWAQKKTVKENFKENHNPFGKRKKEKKNQKGTSNTIAKRGGIFKRFNSRSNGNADAFATHSISGSKGFMYKVFHPGGGGSSRNASLRKTKPGRVQNKEQPKLFHRLMSNNKGRHEKIQGRQRKERHRNRKRGNDVFSTKKR
jgi:hypothetical protein